MDDVIRICRLQDKHEASLHGGMDRRGRSDDCAADCWTVSHYATRLRVLRSITGNELA